MSLHSSTMQEAQILRNAMKGMGTDEKAIIRVAATHNAQERAQIAEKFCASFGVELEKELKKELTGHLEDIMVRAFKNRYELWADEIHAAIKGLGTNEKHLIQLVILMNDKDTAEVTKLYDQKYKTDMFKAIAADISNNDWGRLLKGWIMGQNRSVMDPNQGADQLHNAAKGAGTDEDVFIRILCNCTPDNFRQIAQVFQQKYGKPLREIIKKEFTARSEFAFLLAHDYLMNPLTAIAYCVHYAVHGMGTDDRMLINDTLLFSDFFKGQTILQAYSVFGDMKKEVKRDLTGQYEDAVLSMWGIM
uniref:Annexin 9 n=1 Tax=Trepomonas sp. PC1 TaxID=1076344 RepID=A0A146KGA3_9EUKA|eukprot:JAP95497.1 Annexin 9 [Trepomonas sp. PC1]